MCDVCNGMTVAEIERRNDLLIRVCGFLIQQVQGPVPWSYTVGLAETCNAPDLVVLDGCGFQQAGLLRELGDEVVNAGAIARTTLDDLDVGLVEPFPEDLQTGLVAVWENRYAISAEPGDFRQVIFGPSWDT